MDNKLKQSPVEFFIFYIFNNSRETEDFNKKISFSNKVKVYSEYGEIAEEATNHRSERLTLTYDRIRWINDKKKLTRELKELILKVNEEYDFTEIYFEINDFIEKVNLKLFEYNREDEFDILYLMLIDILNYLDSNDDIDYEVNKEYFVEKKEIKIELLRIREELKRLKIKNIYYKKYLICLINEIILNLD